MSDFTIQTRLNTSSPQYSLVYEQLGNPLGLVQGNFTTDGEIPTFIGRSPVNFSLQGCTELCQPCFNSAGTASYPTPVGDTHNIWILMGARSGQEEDQSLAISIPYTYMWCRCAGTSLNVNRGGLDTANDYAGWHRWYIIGKRTIYEDGSTLITLYHVDINLKTNNATVQEITYEVELYSYTPPPEDGDYGDPSEPSDDNGNYDNTSDDIDVPDNTVPTDSGDVTTHTPPISMSGIGLLSIWKVSMADLNAIGQNLWDSNFYSNIVKSFYAPVDAVVTLNIVPSISDVLTYGTGDIYLGNYNTGVTGNKVAKQFYEVDMGQFSFTGFWASALDYNPYTNIQLYLPYIGTVDLSPDSVMNKTIHVRYHIDCVTGQLVSYVYVNDSILYTFTGNCGINVPITGANYANIYKSAIQGTVGLATGIAGAVATGGASAIVQGVGIASGAVGSAVNGSKIQYQHGSAMAMTAGYLAPQYCYLTITRPKQSLANEYNKFVGYPSNITSVLSSLSGFTSVENIHLQGVPATDRELNELNTLLVNGVILPTDGEMSSLSSSLSGSSPILFRNNSETNVMAKSLTSVTTFTNFYLREDTSLVDPVIIVQGSLSTFASGNYCYIPSFGRCYFVSDMIQQNGDVTEIHLRSDPLTSFASSIRGCTAVIARQEKVFNRYLNDPLFKVYQNSDVVTKKLSGSGFGQAGYILVTAGHITST